MVSVSVLILYFATVYAKFEIDGIRFTVRDGVTTCKAEGAGKSVTGEYVSGSHYAPCGWESCIRCTWDFKIEKNPVQRDHDFQCIIDVEGVEYESLDRIGSLNVASSDMNGGTKSECHWIIPCEGGGKGVYGNPINHIINNAIDKINVNLAEYTQITDKFITAFNTQKYKAQQKFEGIDIFSGTMVMEQQIQKQSPIYGEYFNSAAIGADINYDINPVITSDEALQIAMNNYNVVEEQLFGSDLNTNIKLNIYYSDSDNIYYLAYIIKYTFKDSSSDDVYRPFSVINAKNGDIIYSFKAIISSNPASACGDSGNPKIGKTRICNEITAIPDIKDENIEVYNHIGMIRQELFQCTMDPNNNDICEIDDYEINGEYCAACDVYKAGKAVFSLYNEWLDIKPLSDDNIPVELYVHYGTDYENAFYSGSAMYFGDGYETYYPLVSIDIVGHEMAHGFTEQIGSDLLYNGQSGAINEAYSDLVGEVTEYFIRGDTDWQYGYDIIKNPNGAVKYMYDPPLDGKSIDHINDYIDDMNVHHSSGIYNKAFYLLQSKYKCCVEEVFKIATTANLYYWNQNTNFNQGLCGLKLAANDLFGGDQDMIQRIIFSLDNAFLEVGVQCQSVNIYGQQSTEISESNNSYDYYLYGAIIGGVLSVLLLIGVIFCCYHKKTKILTSELDGLLFNQEA